MMPYFFAGGHHNYVRSDLVYLRTIDVFLKISCLTSSMGNTLRHMEGLCNGTWSDFFESTFTRYMHCQTGIVGITLEPKTLKTRALSRHVQPTHGGPRDLRGYSDDDRYQDKHREEATARIVRKIERVVRGSWT